MAPNCVQAALDLAGSRIIPDLIEITGDPSKVLSIADVTADEYGVKTSFEPRNLANSLQKALELFDAGLFTLPVAQIFPMDQIALAHDISAGSHAKGRLIIKVNQ